MKGIVITPNVEAKCRTVFHNEHAKFMTKSMLLLDDLDREFVHNDHTYTIVGMWINEDVAIDIIIHDESKVYYKASHRDVSHMMGYFRYRNPISGIEFSEDHSKKRLRSLTLEETGA